MVQMLSKYIKECDQVQTFSLEYENLLKNIFLFNSVQGLFSFSFWQSLVSINVSNTTSLEDKSKEKNIKSTATITNKRASSMTTRTVVLLLHIFVTLLSTKKMIKMSSNS